MEKHKQKRSINELSTALLELLKSNGYSSKTLTNCRCVLSRIRKFMGKRKLANYSENTGKEFYNFCTAKNPCAVGYQQRIRAVLRRLDELNNNAGYTLAKRSPEIPSPIQFSGLLEAYTKFCISIRNKENTVAKKRKFCRDFLCNLYNAGCKNTRDINAAYIGKAILKETNLDSYAAIRSFLRHLHDNGFLNNDFSGIIPKYRRVIPLPATYTDDEINRLENSIDRTTSAGKRDYALFLIASRLGMRAGDIADLTFENIDFNHDRISFKPKKAGKPQTLPLLQEIRAAIQEYIRHARPNAANNYLFIRINAPFEKISTSIIRHTIAKHFKAAGIDISSKKHGPRALRSSMASSMVNSDVPYDVVREAPGHASPQAIKRYAKADIENLRLYAIDVPGPTGTFAAILQGRE
jgi:integrase